MSDIKEKTFLSHEQIEETAYELYLKRGAGDGQALDDWLAAENRLKALKKDYDDGDFPLSKKVADAGRSRGARS
jgi:hypothetical protein